ncbi:MAG TPA: YARHG domain-containing protein, partial [Cyclobacteriaceae bacterium]|nr:YARHG domain-containing protein [Cyclobacteriaceae bacterium]
KTTFNGGIIIYPSFVKDFGITAIANDNVMLKQNDYAGTSNTEIRFEKVESISDRLFGLVSFFMEAGVSGRDYHSQQNNLIVVNKNLNKLRQQKIISYEIYHVPCGTDWQYKKIGPGLYESNDGIGTYNYYKIMPDGNIEQLETVRSYNFTKFVNIDESYFRHCQYESLKYNEPQGGPIPNVVVTQGISMDELDIMRNEIFAEYGFIFKSPKWKKYFESKPWYKPQHDNVDQFLTEIDKHNIKFLLEFQRENKDHKVQRDSIIFPWAGG